MRSSGVPGAEGWTSRWRKPGDDTGTLLLGPNGSAAGHERRSPRSSGDRAPPSGGGSAGSNPAGGAAILGPDQLSDLRVWELVGGLARLPLELGGNVTAEQLKEFRGGIGSVRTHPRCAECVPRR